MTRRAFALFWQRRAKETPILIAITTKHYAHSIPAHFEWEGRWFIKPLDISMNDLITFENVSLIAVNWPGKEDIFHIHG